ncbi:hypothetical protein [Haloplanus natans]|uniref:hypothetical protein n=1 Tax=Haloplanus natans TaxID=376171 RepID=UPI0012F9E254|nr:hypothetical protein [Haloplanus natans]
MYFFARPVVGITLGAVVLGERTGISPVAGGAVLALGVFLVDRSKHPDDEQS